jgi:hypothetical protein
LSPIWLRPWQTQVIPHPDQNPGRRGVLIIWTTAGESQLAARVGFASPALGADWCGCLPGSDRGRSNQWLLALGMAMIAAGVWTIAAVGVAAIAGVYSVAMVGYVIVDAFNGEVTAAHIASHVPVLAGMEFAVLVARERAGAIAAGTSMADQPVASRPHHRRYDNPS